MVVGGGEKPPPAGGVGVSAVDLRPGPGTGARSPSWKYLKINFSSTHCYVKISFPPHERFNFDISDSERQFIRKMPSIRPRIDPSEYARQKAEKAEKARIRREEIKR